LPIKTDTLIADIQIVLKIVIAMSQHALCAKMDFLTQEDHAWINARIIAIVVQIIRSVIHVAMDFIVVVIKKYVQIHAIRIA
jgi:hypothetical protein